MAFTWLLRNNRFFKRFQSAGKGQRPIRRARVGLETLESRLAPAQLVGANTVLYHDSDGDLVSVKFSQHILTATNVNNVFTFSSGANAVNGNTTTKESLQQIDLTQAGTIDDGLDISVTVKKATA